MDFILPCIASFILTSGMTPVVIRLATKCNCLDIPGGRRQHLKATPLWGGTAFFVGVLPLLLNENGNGALTHYIAASLILIVMGMIDDRISLGWKQKFAVMAAASTIVIFGSDTVIHHIGIYGTLGRVDLGWFSIPFTYLSIIGITNAINLIDGLDGLAGGVSLLGFLFMGIAALLAGNIPLAVICFAFVGALAAFLLFNFPKARIFMGDSGSLFLGFSLAIIAVKLTQSSTSSVNALFPALVLLIPIFDTLRVLIVRLLNGKNPFRADSLHLHYLLVQKNVTPVNVTLLLWMLTAVFGSIALTLSMKTSESYIAVVLGASSLLSLWATGLTRNAPSLKESGSEPLHQYGIPAEPTCLNGNEITITGFNGKGELLTLTGIVVVGIVLLTV
jgi:UDP-GlcNAc:undecaprenyl-phosphate GlcNAc-1-phosphate transferase